MSVLCLDFQVLGTAVPRADSDGNNHENKRQFMCHMYIPDIGQECHPFLVLPKDTAPFHESS